jgi:hypothetical protein
LRSDNMELDQTTSNDVINRNDKGQFLKGTKGVGGRKTGSRNKLGEAFIADLYNDYLENGADVIAAVRESDPVAYLRIISHLLPQKAEVDINHAVQIVQIPSPKTNAELEQLHHQRLLDVTPPKG